MLSKVSDTFHVSSYLVGLAANDLDDISRQDLVRIIDQLFIDLKDGHSCSYINNLAKILSFKKDYILKLLFDSKIVATYKNYPQFYQAQPISIVDISGETLIYISKYLYYELSLVNMINKLYGDYSYDQSIWFTQIKHLSDSYGLPNKEQLTALELVVKKRLSIITGGPGTGKTTIITLMLWLMYKTYGNKIKIKICAPTGKASIRVKQSIESSLGFLEGLGFYCEEIKELFKNDNSFSTIHKLLGYVDKSIYFKHNKDNLLDIDILIIDESSMIGLPLFSKLLEAVNLNQLKHVILLGDRNQLSSVEEGYVFASLVTSGNKTASKVDLFSQNKTVDFVCELKESKRNEGDVFNLANAILNENLPLMHDILLSSDMAKLINIEKIKLDVEGYLSKISECMVKELNISELFNIYNQQAILCLTNVGKYGTDKINQEFELKIKLLMNNYNEWYPGRAIIVLQNDYNLGLYNGDIGICLLSDGITKIYFANGIVLLPELLPKYTLAYAITVHKSQGSEYEAVNLVLCEDANLDVFKGLLTKELIYTGVTRAKKSIKIYASEFVLNYALNNQTKRNTGLNFMLDNYVPTIS